MKALRSGISMIIYLTWLFSAVTSMADDASRDFTSTNGCTIRGTLLDYDLENQIAIILREGKTDPCLAAITAFCEADRQFIRTWAMRRDFRDSMRISVRLKDVRRKQKISDARYDPEFIKCQAYEVELENQFVIAIANVEVEYCLFYQQIEREGTMRTRQDGVLCSRVKIGTIAAGFRQCLETEPVLIYDQGHRTGLFGSDATSYGEIQGLWLRLTATLPSGEKLIRDQCFPENLGTYMDWTTTTRAAGLNRRTDRSAIRCPGIAPVELPSGFHVTIN